MDLSVDFKQFKAILIKNYTNHEYQTLREALHKVRGGMVYVTLPQLNTALRSFHDAIKVQSQNTKQLNILYHQVLQAIDAFWQLDIEKSQ